MSRPVLALETPPVRPTAAELHARACRFHDLTLTQWSQAYRELTPEEKAWIETGEGDPPAAVKRLHEAREKGWSKL
jgi:hypothetical protein